MAFEGGHDWAHADQPLVTIALRQSRQEWRTHSPVDRAARKAAQKHFDGILQRLQGRLHGEYTRNIAEEQSLIARAQKALGNEDGRKAVNDAQHPQQRWKAAGPVPRAEDGRLSEESEALRRHLRKTPAPVSDLFWAWRAHDARTMLSVSICQYIGRVPPDSNNMQSGVGI